METIENNNSFERELSFLSPYFLGAYGENAEILENLLVDFVRDHIYWRRNFHPEDQHPVTSKMQHSDEYQASLAKIKQELQSLSAKLKKTLPISSPRYLGHMGSDLLLPALLAQLITTFYNPNNTASEQAEVTIKMELAVGEQFAEMFGFNISRDKSPCAWGHLTSGGSDANYESLWNFRAVKYYPVAIVEAAKRMNIKLDFARTKFSALSDMKPWELINFSIDEVMELRELTFSKIRAELGKSALKEFSRLVEENRLETIGLSQFFAEHWKFHQPVVLVPTTAYSFWEKAMRLLGFGCASLIEVPVTTSMRMDEFELERILSKLQTQNIPVLAVIGVLGTRDFGTIDPINQIVSLRDKFAQQGFNFYIHVDASNGGYLKALFRDASGKLLSHDAVKSELDYFPSNFVYESFKALPEVDSITMAPHTYGYLPQGIGAFIARNREIVKLLNHSERNLLDNEDKLELSQLGRFILDGAKPGANAAAAFVTHKVLPLDSDHFGRLVKQTIRSAEYFYKKINALQERLKDEVILRLPFDPDTNLIPLSINLIGNKSLSTMNSFMNAIFQNLAFNPESPMQTKAFLTSKAELHFHYLSESERQTIFEQFGLECEDYTSLTGQQLITLRHSFMNPWLTTQNNGLNYIDQYCEFLENTILRIKKAQPIKI